MNGSPFCAANLLICYFESSIISLVLFFSSLEKFWFCRLSLNHKVLHYGDLDESPQGEVPFELLSDKSEMLHNNQQRCPETSINVCNDSISFSVPVCDIKSVLTGKDCPHMKEKSALKQNKVMAQVWFSAAQCVCCCFSVQ